MTQKFILGERANNGLRNNEKDCLEERQDSTESLLLQRQDPEIQERQDSTESLLLQGQDPEIQEKQDSTESFFLRDRILRYRCENSHPGYPLPVRPTEVGSELTS